MSHYSVVHIAAPYLEGTGQFCTRCGYQLTAEWQKRSQWPEGQAVAVRVYADGTRILNSVDEGSSSSACANRPPHFLSLIDEGFTWQLRGGDGWPDPEFWINEKDGRRASEETAIAEGGSWTAVYRKVRGAEEL